MPWRTYREWTLIYPDGKYVIFLDADHRTGPDLEVGQKLFTWAKPHPDCDKFEGCFVTSVIPERDIAYVERRDA